MTVLILSFVDKKTDNYDNKLLDNYIKEQIAMIMGERPSILTSKKSTNYKASSNMEEKLQCSDLYHMGLPFWCSSISCMFTYIAVVNYVMIASSVLQV